MLFVTSVPEKKPEEVRGHEAEWTLVDVRTPEEWQTGIIAGAKLVTMGPDLEEYLSTVDPSTPLLFVCHIGGRSRECTREAVAMGFSKAFNLVGGMVLWSQMGYPVTR